MFHVSEAKEGNLYGQEGTHTMSDLQELTNELLCDAVFKKEYEAL